MKNNATAAASVSLIPKRMNNATAASSLTPMPPMEIGRLAMINARGTTTSRSSNGMSISRARARIW
jgi:hypothetical protein